MIIGYARVSTSHQTTDGQVDALTAAGAEKIYSDVMSGGRDDRPGLTQMLEHLRTGDTVIVVALDRLGRSLSGIVRTVQTLTERGVILRSQRESIDTGTEVGHMLVGIFGALAQYEKSLIAERAAVAREAAAVRGRPVGRPRSISDDQLRAMVDMRAAGTSMAVICQTLKISRSTAYKALGERTAAV